MARTFKDKPFKVTGKYYARWNDCPTHGRQCSHSWRYNKSQCLKRRAFLEGEK